MVYCFIRWVTFLGVFKKRESLCLFAGSFKTVSPTPLATPSFRVDVHRPFSLRQGNETFHGKFERKPIPTLKRFDSSWADFLFPLLRSSTGSERLAIIQFLTDSPRIDIRT